MLGLTALSHAIDEDFGPPARQTPQPGVLQPPEDGGRWQLRHLRQMDDFRRAEAVDVQPRESLLHVAEQVLAPREVEFRVKAALEENLIAAQGQRLFDLAEELFAPEDVALGVAGPAGEGAEAAAAGADVRVVDVPVDVVGAVGFWVKATAHRVGGAAQGRQVVRLQQPQPFLGRQPIAAFGFRQDGFDHWIAMNLKCTVPSPSGRGLG